MSQPGRPTGRQPVRDRQPGERVTTGWRSPAHGGPVQQLEATPGQRGALVCLTGRRGCLHVGPEKEQLITVFLDLALLLAVEIRVGKRQTALGVISQAVERQGFPGRAAGRFPVRRLVQPGEERAVVERFIVKLEESPEGLPGLPPGAAAASRFSVSFIERARPER